MELGQRDNSAVEFHPQPGDKSARGSRPFVLVVDDDPGHRRLLELVNEYLEVNVHAVESAEEALELLMTVPFDLVLLDCRMPSMSGFECATEWRHREGDRQKRIPIIAITGLNEDGTASRCLNSGMNACLFKPFELGALKELIHKLAPAAN